MTSSSPAVPRSALITMTGVLMLAVASGARVEPESDAPIATSAIGAVTESELASWLRHRPISRRGDRERQIRHRLEDLLLEELLVRRFDRTSASSQAAYRSWYGVLERRLASRALQSWVVTQAEPTPDQIETVRSQLPPPDLRPRWRLRNLFLKLDQEDVPSVVAARRREAELLRERLVHGAEFEALARESSDSLTRVRGGRLGWVRLDQLRPELAKQVEALTRGELSPVIETPDGFTIIWCEDVSRPSPPDSESLDRRARELILAERLPLVRKEIETASRARLAPRRIDSPSSDPDAPVVAFEDGSHLTRRDVAYASQDRNDRPPVDEVEWEIAVEKAISEVIVFEAARHAGRLDESSFRTELKREDRGLRAELQLRELAAPKIRDPEPDAIRSAFEASSAELVEPRQVQLVTVELPLGEGVSRRDVDRFTTLAAEIDSERSSEPLENLLLISDRVELVEHGWVGPKQIFRLGKALEAAVLGIGDPDGPPGAGAVVGPVQDGPRLAVARIVDVREKRSLTFEEARPRLERALRAQSEKQARADVRSELLRELNLVVLRPEVLTKLASTGESRP